MLKKFDSLDTNKKGIIIGCMFLFMITFILFGPKVDHSNDNKNTELIKMFEKVGNNYSLEVTINDKEEDKIIYSTDGKVEMYKKDKTYLLSDKKWFLYDEQSDSITKLESKPLMDDYYNINIIKRAVKYCNNKEKDNEIDCQMKVSDYVNTRNEYNNLSYKVTDKELVNFIIKHNEYVNEIDVDYSYINKIITNEDDSLKYNIKISNVNGNDYSNLLEKISSYVETNEANEIK